ncbi:hypothetical protein PR048_003426 [Dryococelus australis]|uniref:Uncharacterized protein n=1 Tax=Dryococelus australis TaxID=614101 RepID=A0ABQ9IN10_9NEOP|nr:hypothetical protein PR048_003426 [Dryococelus australis]
MLFSSEHNKRVNLNWNNNNTVTFQQTRQYVFRPELSKGSVHDNITTVNVIAVVCTHVVHRDNNKWMSNTQQNRCGSFSGKTTNRSSNSWQVGYRRQHPTPVGLEDHHHQSGQRPTRLSLVVGGMEHHGKKSVTEKKSLKGEGKRKKEAITCSFAVLKLRAISPSRRSRSVSLRKDGRDGRSDIQKKVSKGSTQERQAAAYFTRYDSVYLQIIMDGFLERLESISTTHTVGEMLFNGYDDKLLDLVNELHIQKFKLPFKKFAWFAERNNSASYDGWFNMYTGEDDVRNLGNLYAWNFGHTTPYYKSTCGVVRGSTGELMPPMEGLDEIFVFSPDLCASLSLIKTGEFEAKGMVGTKFAADLRNLDNGTYFPEKYCFTSGEMIPSGALNISLCKWNALLLFHTPTFTLLMSRTAAL